jgi:hypothetical protein
MGYEVTDNAGRVLSGQQYDAIRNHNLVPYKFSFLKNAWMSFRTLWKPIDITYNYTTGGYRFDGKWSWKHNMAIGLLYGLLLPFGFAGLLHLARKKNKLAVFFGSVLLFHTVIHVLFIPFTRFRYRIPVDFILIILGCSSMLVLFSWFIQEFINRDPG